jgi:hypothetical protein
MDIRRGSSEVGQLPAARRGDDVPGFCRSYRPKSVRAIESPKADRATPRSSGSLWFKGVLREIELP